MLMEREMTMEEKFRFKKKLDNLVRKNAEFMERENAKKKDCPVDWFTSVEVDDNAVVVTITYKPHGNDKASKRQDLCYFYTKEDVIEWLPERVCAQPFELVNYIKRIDDIKWAIAEDIDRSLKKEAEKMNDNGKSSEDISETLLFAFSHDPRYYKQLAKVAKYEAILKSLKTAKSAKGDVRYHIRNQI